MCEKVICEDVFQSLLELYLQIPAEIIYQNNNIFPLNLQHLSWAILSQSSIIIKAPHKEEFGNNLRMFFLSHFSTKTYDVDTWSNPLNKGILMSTHKHHMIFWRNRTHIKPSSSSSSASLQSDKSSHRKRNKHI